MSDTASVTAKLQEHVDTAVSQFESGEIGFSQAQEAAVARKPGSEIGSGAEQNGLIGFTANAANADSGSRARGCSNREKSRQSLVIR